MIRCVIVDDEPWALELLKSYISGVTNLELSFATQNPVEALDYMNNHSVDLLFLDIQMPEMTGLQLMSLANKNLPIIITSAYSEYALEGYSFNVVDYLLKPIELSRFMKAVQKVQDLIGLYSKHDPLPAKEKTNPFFFIKTDGRLCKILIQDVNYLESKRDYVQIHLQEESLLTLDSLNNFELQLAEHGFIRIHKSYLISIQKIDFVEGNRVKIGDDYLPIGETYKKKFLQFISS